MTSVAPQRDSEFAAAWIARWGQRVNEADWAALAAELSDHGCALMPRLLTPEECAGVAALYDDPGLFRSTIDMKRYRFGEGEYRYFKAPLPEPVEALRQSLYPRLLPIARDWYRKLGREAAWPETLSERLRMRHMVVQSLLHQHGASAGEARCMAHDQHNPF